MTNPGRKGRRVIESPRFQWSPWKIRRVFRGVIAECVLAEWRRIREENASNSVRKIRVILKDFEPIRLKDFDVDVTILFRRSQHGWKQSFRFRFENPRENIQGKLVPVGDAYEW